MPSPPARAAATPDQVDGIGRRLGEEPLKRFQPVQRAQTADQVAELGGSPILQPLDRAFRDPRGFGKLGLGQAAPEARIGDPTAEFRHDRLIRLEPIEFHNSPLSMTYMGFPKYFFKFDELSQIYLSCRKSSHMEINPG